MSTSKGEDSSTSKEKESEMSSDSKKSEETSSSSSISKPDLSVEAIREYLAQKLGFSDVIDSKTPKQKSKNIHKQILETVDFDGVIKHWKNGNFKNIVLMVGAGISTSAGIPDFRSPETGLYNNLQKYKLPYPTAIFELDYFEKNPQPFYSLAKELYPGTFKPTPCHYFIKLLNEKGILQRLYTQNIDTLERIAGIDDEKMVEAHGSFYTNHCIDCRKEYDMKWVKQKIFEDVIPTCDCNGIIKPDIVFFGENLPDKFHNCPDKDFRKCDLLIIMGTSLEVQPFASLTERVNDKCVRLLINREIVGQSKRSMRHLLFGEGLCFDSPDNFRDVAWTGDCDDGAFLIADKLGWGDELRDMIKREYAIIDRTKDEKTPEETPEKKEEDKSTVVDKE